jgi:hypothetical protein
METPLVPEGGIMVLARNTCSAPDCGGHITESRILYKVFSGLAGREIEVPDLLVETCDKCDEIAIGADSCDIIDAAIMAAMPPKP